MVSIVIPVRNEERYVSRCLDALLQQEGLAAPLEIIVVDGLSDDRSREIVTCYTNSGQGAVRLLANPRRITSSALNIGIAAARGEVIIILGAHTVVAPDFVAESLAALGRSAADCVGGTLTTVGESDIARAIALAMSSPFGVGDARFRYSNVEGFVDTVAFGAYRRAVFARIGLFDEELVRNQDDEFNYRLRESGGRIYLAPSIRAKYFSRSTFTRLFSQYLQYGFWKVRVAQKHPRMMQWRHFVPAAFVSALAGLGLLSLFSNSARWALAALLSVYLAASLATSTAIAAKRGWRYLPLLPLAFACLHFGYGVGFLIGLVRFWRFGLRSVWSETGGRAG